MISLAARLAHVLKLNNCLAKGALITTQPATPAVLNWDLPTLQESPGRFFMMRSITQDLLGVPELVDFKQRPSVLE